MHETGDRNDPGRVRESPGILQARPGVFSVARGSDAGGFEGIPAATRVPRAGRRASRSASGNVRRRAGRQRGEDGSGDGVGRPALIPYLDSSALVKVYVREAGREIVWQAVAESAGIATSMLSNVELRAAFARLRREEALTGGEHEDVVAALDVRWVTYERSAVTESPVRLAGGFARCYSLRGYDAVQLASAYICQEQNDDLRFLAFDRALNAAAGQLVALYSLDDASQPPGTDG